MKIKFLVSIISSILVMATTTFPTIRTSDTQCGCVCAVVCDNKCEFECSGCQLVEGARLGALCCDQAFSTTPPTGPCGGGNAY